MSGPERTASPAGCCVVYLTRGPHETRQSTTQSAGWYFYFRQWPADKPAIGPYDSTEAALQAASGFEPKDDPADHV